MNDEQVSKPTKKDSAIYWSTPGHRLFRHGVQQSSTLYSMTIFHSPRGQEPVRKRSTRRTRRATPTR